MYRRKLTISGPAALHAALGQVLYYPTSGTGALKAQFVPQLRLVKNEEEKKPLKLPPPRKDIDE